jgi:hypothetical protein
MIYINLIAALVSLFFTFFSIYQELPGWTVGINLFALVLNAASVAHALIIK